MASSGRPPCPCCVQRAEHVLAAARRRIAAALAAVGLAGLAAVCWSARRAGRRPARTVSSWSPSRRLAAAAFVVLPLVARARRPARAGLGRLADVAARLRSLGGPLRYPYRDVANW